MNICVVSQDYPDSKRVVFPFVKNLVDMWGQLGHKVTVISPFSVTHNKVMKPFEELPHPSNVDIVRPLSISFSNIKLFGIPITERAHCVSVNRALERSKIMPDIIYCHFWDQAIAAYNFAKKKKIPLVVATGESVIPKHLGEEPYRSICNYVSRVVCVSSKNMNESIELGLTTEEKCCVFPNSIDTNLFKVTNETKLKKQLGIQKTDFVLAFVGWFIERKGSLRVSRAIEKLDDSKVKILFIGKGPDEPTCNGILFKGSLPHNEVPKYLNCADAFILPTLAEGCCNAVVEAMACGLPIISSNKDFNRDVLNDENSIMVNPMDVDELVKAIATLRDDEKKRRAMSKASIKTVENLKIELRAKRIIEYIGASLMK